ncbi:hypothetical protein DRO61_06550 [Candidatus Bathyarchaeota archaeon]|nr:MAG: hypothetical protein DRO61_06550 [Candidatus Bathyarchaeota archaeon]
MGHRKALVLNVDYTCIGLTSWENAASALYKDQVDIVDFYSGDKITCADGSNFPVAAVIVCRVYKNHMNKVPFSRKNIFIRDRLTCQYCSKRMHFSKLTFDHVYPRSEHKKNNSSNSPTNWENIVTCCHSCNTKKGCLTLEKCGMNLIKKPERPSPHGYVKGIAPWTILQKEWVPYLQGPYKHYLEICETV